MSSLQRGCHNRKMRGEVPKKGDRGPRTGVSPLYKIAGTYGSTVHIQLSTTDMAIKVSIFRGENFKII